MIKTRVVAMKCEIKYVVHDQIKVFTEHTLKEILIMIPVCTVFVLFLNWCDFEVKFLWAMLIIAVVIDLCISSVAAIKYCKSKKE